LGYTVVAGWGSRRARFMNDRGRGMKRPNGTPAPRLHLRAAKCSRTGLTAGTARRDAVEVRAHGGSAEASPVSAGRAECNFAGSIGKIGQRSPEGHRDASERSSSMQTPRSGQFKIAYASSGAGAVIPYARIFRQSVVRPMPRSSAARERMPPVCASAASIAARSSSAPDDAL